MLASLMMRIIIIIIDSVSVNTTHVDVEVSSRLVARLAHAKERPLLIRNVAPQLTLLGVQVRLEGYHVRGVRIDRLASMKSLAVGVEAHALMGTFMGVSRRISFFAERFGSQNCCLRCLRVASTLVVKLLNRAFNLLLFICAILHLKINQVFALLRR